MILTLFMVLALSDTYNMAEQAFMESRYLDTIEYATKSMYKKPAASNYLIGYSLFYLGKPEEAVGYFKTSLAKYEQREQPRGVYLASLGLARISIILEDFPEANLHLSRAILTYERHRELDMNLSFYYYLVGRMYIHQGEYRKALLNTENALIWYRKKGDPRGVGEALSELGYLKMMFGDFSGGILATIESEGFAIQNSSQQIYHYNLVNWILYLRCHNMEYSTLVEDIREYCVATHDSNLEAILQQTLKSRCIE